MHLVTFSDFVLDMRPATDIAPVVVWQNVLLSYNLISATIPALKGFVKGFTTGGVGYTRNISVSGGGDASHNSYELRPISLFRGRVKLVPEDYPDSEVRVTTRERRPKAASSRAHKTTNERMRSHNDEIASIHSGESRQIMIKRHWEVSRA